MNEKYSINTLMYLWELKLKGENPISGVFITPLIGENLICPIALNKDFAFCPKDTLSEYESMKQPFSVLPSFIKIFNSVDVEYFKTIKL